MDGVCFQPWGNGHRDGLSNLEKREIASNNRKRKGDHENRGHRLTHVKEEVGNRLSFEDLTLQPGERAMSFQHLKVLVKSEN